MKWSTTLWLLVLALLLGGLIWLGERSPPPPRRVAGEEPLKVLRFSPGQVAELEIAQGELVVSLVRKEGAWFMVSPVQGRADAGEVDRILGVLETLYRREVVTADERHRRDLALSDYGLAPPRARIVLQDAAGRHELLVGGDAPLGALVYINTVTSEDVVAVSRDVLSVLPQDLLKLRDRTILPGDPARTARIEFQRAGGGLVQLAPAPGGWMIQQPLLLRADSARVHRMLDALYTLQAERFVSDPPRSGAATQDVARAASPSGDDARLETYGLAADTAQLRIQVWAPGDQVGKELRIGKPVDETATLLYAKQRDQSSIYAVPAAITNLLAVTLNDLRDRNLFSLEAAKIRRLGFQTGEQKLTLLRDATEGWNIVEPVQWKADDELVDDLAMRVSRLRIESVIDNAGTNMSAYRLEAPAFSLSVAELAAPGTNAAAAESKPDVAPAVDVCVSVGRPAAGDDMSYVMFKGSPTVLAVAEAALQPLRLRLRDPLLYRNRTMLALRAPDVWRIVLTKGAVEQAAVRAESGEWGAAGTATQAVDKAVLADVLALASNLRALRIECHNPRHLESYGLDRTGTTLSFSLSGKEGIQRTLILGFRARADGVYAMIQGQDVVFVLTNSVAELLTRDLSRPVAQDASAQPVKSGSSR